jgi:hypothetical protein
VYDMVDPEATRPTVQTINGKPFNVHLIRQTQLIPLQSGTFVIDPVELDNKVTFIKQTINKERPQGSRMQQLMDEFMNDGARGEIEEHSFTLASKPVTIIVKPLPTANKPASFNGAVGKFTMQATCKNKTVAAGEEISLRVVVTGAGNLTVINPPAVPLPEGLEGFDPTTKENVDKSIYPLSGSKTFDYTFVAKDTGTYKISSIEFSYFNPVECAYKTLRSDSFSILVTPAVRKKGNRLNNSFKNEVVAEEKWFDAISLSDVLWVLAIVFGGALGIYQWRKSRRPRIKLPPEVVKSPVILQEPDQTDKDPLEGARWKLQQGHSQDFYNEVNRSVWKTIAGKIQVPATELNKFNITTQLQSKGADSGLIYRLQSLLSECEIALYTPLHTATDMEQTLQKATSIINEIQASFT